MKAKNLCQTERACLGNNPTIFLHISEAHILHNHSSHRSPLQTHLHHRRQHISQPLTTPSTICFSSSSSASSTDGSLYSSTERDTDITSFGFARNFYEKYQVAGEALGEGTFGTVKRAICRETGHEYAVKHMPKRFQSNLPNSKLEYYFVRRVRNEVDICSHLGKSLNVCYFYGAYEDDDSVDLVFEVCSGGHLWNAITGGSYGERDAARLVRDVLRTVAQCHAQGVLMRDIKPENFLFSSTQPGAPLKAIDFGLSVFCSPGQIIDVRAGTAIYIAPEVLKCAYSLPADLWSVGIVAYQLLAGKLPFSGEEGSEVSELYMTQKVYHHKDVFRAVLYADLDFINPPWTTIVSPAAKELIQMLLSRDPAERPTAEEALGHRWFKEQLAEVIEDSNNSSTTNNSDNNNNESLLLFDATVVQRLQRFGTYGRLKQAALKRIAQLAQVKGTYRLPDNEMQRVFFELDSNGKGSVCHEELRSALFDERFDLSDDEAEQLLSQVDNASGEVDYQSWMAALGDWGALRGSPEWESLLKDVFDSLDVRGKGVIGGLELEGLLCGPDGCEFPDDVGAALREADVDHDGGISYGDFRQFMDAQRLEKLELFENRVRSLSSRK